jgi:hypothetical protein
MLRDLKFWNEKECGGNSFGFPANRDCFAHGVQVPDCSAEKVQQG